MLTDQKQNSVTNPVILNSTNFLPLSLRSNDHHIGGEKCLDTKPELLMTNICLCNLLKTNIGMISKDCDCKLLL